MRRFVGIALLLAGLAQLGFRGMQRVRSDVPLWDFVSVHSATRNWLHGGDPYDLQGVISTWRESGIFTDRDVSYFATVYPPSSLAIIVPLALLGAKLAMLIWLALTIALLMLQFVALADMARLSRGDSRTLLLVGAAVASAPLQFGILAGQLSMPAISLIIVAAWCAGRGRDRLAGVLLGLACAIKPQVAGPFVIYYLAVRRLRVAGLAMLIGGGIFAIGAAAMQYSHLNWIDGWRQSIAATTRVAGVNDYGWSAPFRDEIVDLKMLLVSANLPPLLLRASIALIVLALIVWYIRFYPRGVSRNCSEELLALSALAAISLLPVYHRVYDAALLTTALAWALIEMDGRRGWQAWALFIPMLVFLIPFDVVKSVRNRLPGLADVSQTWWWQSFIAPHYAWGLIGLTLVLLLIMTRKTAEMKDKAEQPQKTLANLA